MKKLNLRSLLYYTTIPLMLAFTISMLIPNFGDYYDSLKKPFALDSKVFIIAWSILYVLMGISAYLVDNSNKENIKSSLLLYYLQLFVNLMWPIVFFWLKKTLLALGIIILLTLMVAVLIIKFFKIKKISAYLLIPYLLWLLFATYLNLQIFIYN